MPAGPTDRAAVRKLCHGHRDVADKTQPDIADLPPFIGSAEACHRLNEQAARLK
jgi:hypothetical protein